MLTVEEVRALAPHAAAAQRAASSATPERWPERGRDDRGAWGACRGGAGDPYAVVVTLDGARTRCSCPSRQSPCRHALGLLLLLAVLPDAVPVAVPPEPVGRWLDGPPTRRGRGAEPADPAARAAKAARVQAREEKVDAGVEELDRWLADLVRQGLASAPGRPYAYWDDMAARLVDAQAPGLAGRVRGLAGIAVSGDGWEERLLGALGRLHLAVRGWRRRADLGDATRADLRAVVGWPVPTDEVLATPPVRDRWVVLGRRRTADDRLRVQRVWLRGRGTGRDALSLSFAGPGQDFDASLVPATEVDADLCFYPGSRPLRALVAARHAPAEAAPDLPVTGSVAGVADALAAALAADPWSDRLPVVLAGAVPQRDGRGWALRDGDGALLPLAGGPDDVWPLVAVAGGVPVTVAGEWSGVALTPLTVAARGSGPVPLPAADSAVVA